MKQSIEYYIKGQGLDTSTESKIDKKHLFKSYNNLYSLHPEIKFESLDFIYNEDSINTTKFSIILLNEWVKYLKVNGYLIVSFKENNHLNNKKMNMIYEKYLKRHLNLVEHKQNNDEHTFIFSKHSKYLPDNDSIDKWTFGMITVGKRNEWVKLFITSIRSQKIPHYEIIVVGTWNDPEIMGKDITYIPFSEKDDKGWITKKKNIVFENAKYNNVLILHDRFYLDKDWYVNLKKCGNYWDGLVFPIIDKTGFEYSHWGVWSHGLLPIGYADIKDWGEDYYAGGTFMAIKKNLWEKVKLNEKLFWNDQEDADFGLRFTKEGFVTRGISDAKLHTTVTYFNDAPVYEYDDQKLGKPIEYRSAKWKVIQPAIDVCTRVVGLPFLRTRKKASLFLKRFTNKVSAPESGGSRE